VVWGAVLLGLGLGGFFGGIILHQVLQWHHMFTSAGYPANIVENLELNTLGDGLFQAPDGCVLTPVRFVVLPTKESVPAS
jgi:uncharacterized membrane protein